MTRYEFSRESQCDGKVRWGSKKEAKTQARRSETSHGGGRLDAYRCGHCGWWHKGHRPPVEITRAQVTRQ